MATNYDLNNTGPEVQARLDQVFPNQEAISTEEQNRADADAAMREELKAYTDAEKVRAQEAETALADRTTALENQVGSGGSIDTRIADAVNSETQRAQQAEASLRSLYEGLTQSDMVVGPLPETGEERTIYRVPGESSYADYMWNGTAFVKMAEYDNAIDDEPDAESDNPVKGRGIFKALLGKVDKNVGKNLLDFNAPDYEENKHFGEGDSEIWDITGYIAVKGNTNYHLSSRDDITLCPLTGAIIYYDAYKTQIGTEAGSNDKVTITTPAGCAFMRFTLYRARRDHECMVEEGSVRTEYEEYSQIGGDTSIARLKALLDTQTNIKTIIQDTFPARNPYREELAGYFKGYTVDLTGKYDMGFGGILFLGSNYTGDSDIVRGVILDGTGNILASTVNTAAMASGWELLPITAESRKLKASYCINSDGGAVISPTHVFLLDRKTYDAVAAAADIGGLQTDVDRIMDALFNGSSSQTREYTFQTGGVIEQFDPPIEVGDKVTEITGVDHITTYDEDGNRIVIYSNQLPYTADRRIVSGHVYQLPQVYYTFKVVTSASPGLVEQVGDLEDEVDELKRSMGGSGFPQTFMPKKIYGVIGDTLQLFNRGVTISEDPYRMYNDWECGQGKIYKRYIEVTPALAGGSVPSLTIKHRLIDDHYNKSAQSVSALAVAARPSSQGSSINVLCVGASTTANGEWASELKRRLTGTRDSGIPAADGLDGIAFVGRQSLASYDDVRPMPIRVEATGGWTWRTFYTPQDAVRLTVTGVNVVQIGESYSYENGNGQTVRVTVAEVNVTGGSGNIRLTYRSDTEGKGVPAAASGIITRIGTGGSDATITYTSAEAETYCPFYDEDTQQPGFSHYASLYCNNQLDVVIFNMGTINAGITGDSNLSGVLGDMKTLIDALHTDFPACKVIIAPGMLFSTDYGVEYNYGASSALKTWPLVYGQFRYAKAIEDFIGGDDYKNWCFMADTMAEIDSENAFPVGTKAKNTRTSETETIGTNGAHPTLAGYKMVADSIYRCFVNVVLTTE